LKAVSGLLRPTSGQIRFEEGLEKCHHIEDFNRLTGRS
jgi:hypothetical protein